MQVLSGASLIGRESYGKSQVRVILSRRRGAAPRVTMVGLVGVLAGVKVC